MSEYLKKLIELRIAISKLNRQIDEVMPDAIAEALELCESIKNKIVYLDENGKVVLVQRKRFCNPEEDTSLSRLDADIKAATLKLAQKNAVELEEIDSKIQQLLSCVAQLENKREKLLSERYVSRLKKEYKIQQEKSAYSQPILSIFLNK